MARARWWWWLVLAAAAILPRLPAVPVGPAIEDSAYLQHAAESSGVTHIVVESWPPGSYRPLVTTHFEITEFIFGSWMPGHHAFSVILHAVVTWLFFALAVRLVGDRWASFFAALFFAVLPSHNEAIAWAASVGDLWAALLAIVAVRLAVAAPDQEPRQKAWVWTAALICTLAACAAKETAVGIGLMAPLAAWFFARNRPPAAVLATFPSMVTAYILWYSSRVSIRADMVGVLLHPVRWLHRTAQDVAMIVIPFARNEIGDWIWTDRTSTTVATLAFSLAAGWLTVRSARRQDWPVIFGLLWTVCFFFPVWWMTWAERYAYIPSVGLGLVAAGMLRIPESRRPLATPILLALVLAYAVGSALAAHRWAAL